MKTWQRWLEDKMRTAMSGAYPDAYGAAQYPPLAVTPGSSQAAYAYTHQYKQLLGNLRGAKKKHKKKK
jgi:hypothetical protein